MNFDEKAHKISSYDNKVGRERKRKYSVSVDMKRALMNKKALVKGLKRIALLQINAQPVKTTFSFDISVYFQLQLRQTFSITEVF